MKYASLCFRLPFVFFIFLIIECSVANDSPNYSCKNISPLLLFNSNAVVRDYSLTFTVEDIDEAKLKCRYAVTILNSNGQHFGKFSVTYDKFREIDDFKATLYDSDGNKIRELDDDEIKDYAIVPWATLYSDSRIQIAELYHNEYPYTVEFEYEVDYDGYINWPVWYPEEKDASVEYSNFTITVPNRPALRYRCFNMQQKPEITQINSDQKSYSWIVRNLPTLKKEPYGPPWDEQCQSVVVAPAKFKMDDYEGDLTSWESFGKWSIDLWKDRQTLSQDAITKIHSLIDSLKDEKECIKVLYKFMQSCTRYADIIIGIGGWQPIEAQKVYESGYGDCKALTNFMITLLKYAEVKAYPALIYSNDIPIKIEKSFSYNQFNHVIACVPLEGDTVWLECTSQSFPYNHLGSNTENRFALLISDNGGELVKTPASTSQKNEQVRNATVTLSPDGKGAARISTKYSGDQQDFYRYIFNNLTTDILVKWLKENLNISSFKIANRNFSESDDNVSNSVLDMSLLLPHYASAMGKRLFFTPLLIKDDLSIPEEVKDRKFPVCFSYPYSDIDTINYIIPAGYTIEAKPADINIKRNM